MRREPVRGERVGDRRERGLHGAMPFGRCDASREAAAVVEANFFGERLGFGDRQLLEGAGEQRSEQVVAPRRKIQRVIELGHAVLLRRTSGRARAVGATDRHYEVSTRGQLLEVVARHVGVELEPLGDLTRGDALGGVANQQVDVSPGRIAEGVGDRGDGRTEVIGVEGSGADMAGILPTSVVEMSAPPESGLAAVSPGVRVPGENPFTHARTRVIAVASGKGGVGKSSVTTNLAVTLARMGKDVCALDADVWGFSMPRMLGVENGPELTEENQMIPPSAHGVRLLSMGFFVPEDQAVIWRGPMLHKALEQFLTDVAWGEPDYLIIDMPPGTGDVSLSMSQFLPRAEVVIVTTPQPAAQASRSGPRRWPRRWSSM